MPLVQFLEGPVAKELGMVLQYLFMISQPNLSDLEQSWLHDSQWCVTRQVCLTGREKEKKTVRFVRKWKRKKCQKIELREKTRRPVTCTSVSETRWGSGRLPWDSTGWIFAWKVSPSQFIRPPPGKKGATGLLQNKRSFPDSTLHGNAELGDNNQVSVALVIYLFWLGSNRRECVTCWVNNLRLRVQYISLRVQFMDY